MMFQSCNEKRLHISQMKQKLKKTAKICIICGKTTLFLLGTIDSIIFLKTVEAKTKERLRLVHADSLVSITLNGEVVKKLWGEVQLVQRDAYIFCDQARWFENENKIVLLGSVAIYDGKRKLKAKRVDYDGKTRVETASGNVSLLSDKKKLTSQNLTYWQEKDSVSASGDVIISDFIEMATLQGEKGFYDRKLDYGLIEDKPRLVKVDTASDEKLIVNGMKMEVWAQDQRALVSDSVRIEKGDLNAVCQRAEYRADEDLLILTHMPVVWYRDQRMRGNRIDILLEGVTFQGGVIQGSAEIVSEDSTFEDVLKGQKITVEAIQDTIRKIIVEGQASSLYHIFNEEEQNQGINSVTGDHIILTFDENLLERIQVESDPGQCTGIYTPMVEEIGMKAGEKKL